MQYSENPFPAVRSSFPPKNAPQMQYPANPFPNVSSPFPRKKLIKRNSNAILCKSVPRRNVPIPYEKPNKTLLKYKILQIRSPPLGPCSPRKAHKTQFKCNIVQIATLP